MEYINLFTLFVCIIVAFITLNKEKNGVKIIIFSLSFLIPFQTELIPIGLPGALIITFSVIKALKSKTFTKNTSLYKISKKFTLLYYLLVIGIIVGLFNTAVGLDFSDGKTSNISQLWKISFYIIILILFIKIIIPFRNDFNFQNQLLKTFCFSIIIHALGYFLFENLPFAGTLFYHSDYDSELLNTDITRYCSLIGDYELTIDYLLIVIGCSAILYFREKKLINLIYVIPAIWIGIITGTRSFIVVGGLFIILFIFFYLRGFRLIAALTIIGVLSFTIVSKISYLSNFAPSSSLFSRLEQTIEDFNNNGSISNVTNRDFSFAADQLLTKTGPLGNGAFFFNKFENNEMVSHNLFLAMYAKYGIPGIAILLLLIINSIKILFSVVKNANDIYIKTEAKILLFLFICLMIQEYKISAIRNISIIIIYGFLFFLIHCINLRNKALLSNE